MALHRGDFEVARRFLSEAEGYLQKSQDLVGKILIGGPTALCLLRLGHKDAALRRALELLALVEPVRFPGEIVGEGLFAMTEVFLSLWEAGPLPLEERRELAGPLRRALSVLRRCAMVFPPNVPRALLYYGRHAWNHGAQRLALRLAEVSLHRAQRLHVPLDESLARMWLGRFAETPPAAAPGLAGELRSILRFLAGSLG